MQGMREILLEDRGRNMRAERVIEGALRKFRCPNCSRIVAVSAAAIKGIDDLPMCGRCDADMVEITGNESK